MATKKISELTVAGALAGTELIEVVQAGASRQATVSSVAAKAPTIIQLACSDLTTDLTAGTNKGYFRAPKGFTLTAVRASLLTVSSSGTPTVDINVNGSTILSTKLTIDANEKTSTTAATPAVISSATIADDAEITIDLDVAGTGARGLVVTLIGT
jgi:hypothetical protein